MLLIHHIQEKILSRHYLVVGLALCLCVGFGLVFTQQPAYAQDAHGQTSVALKTNGINQLIRDSYTGEGELITLKEHDDYTLEVLFSGGNGSLSYEWALSTDGGLSYTDLNTPTNAYLIKDAKPLADGTSYLYRLYTYDQSIQRTETIFEVVVTPQDKQGEGDDPGKGTRDNPDDNKSGDSGNTADNNTSGSSSNPQSQQASYQKGKPSPKTSDEGLVFMGALSLIALGGLSVASLAKRQSKRYAASKDTNAPSKLTDKS